MTTATTRPPKMEVDADSIPTELRSLRRWVVWSWKLRNGKWDKPPMQVDGTNARSNDPSTWCTFDEALAADGFDGIGFVLGDGIVGVDFDDCRDPETGILNERVASWIKALDSYCEVSPSGSGVKLLVRAELLRAKVNHERGIEIYPDRRYFTLTGHRVPNTPATIAERQKALDWLIETFVDAKRHRGNVHAGANPDDRETAVSALQCIPNSGTGLGYEDWIRVGMALHSIDGDLFSAWDAWSRQSTKYIESECRRKWSSFNGQGDIKIGTLLYMAQQHGWKPPTTATKTTTTDKTTTKVVVSAITNCTVVTGDDGKPTTEPLSMADIITTANAVTNSWPRRVADALFVHAGDDVHFLRTDSALFGYYHSQADVHWTRGARYVTKAELFAEMQRTSTAYDAVEMLPHEPRLPKHYYTCGVVDAGNGDHLRTLVDRFAPSTDIDRDLILAAFVTPGWGGPAGTRPAFCVTSDFGRGVGKTTLAENVGLVWNGILSFSHHEDIGKIKTRLLTPDAMTRRVALLDNVKSLRFSWSELEAMVTSTTIGGHRMYCGEGTRPNTLSWFITLNGASLSTDMAQRSVIIKLDKPSRSGSWSDDTRWFIDKHRPAIVADVVGFLRSDAMTLERFSRWSNWERDVLARLPEPSEAQKVIEERQHGVDVEAEEAATIEDYFADRLRSLRYRDDEWVFVPSGVATQWYNAAQNDKLTVSQVTRMMQQAATEGRLKRLRWHRMPNGRGFLWTPTTDGTGFATDLNERLAGCWK